MHGVQQGFAIEWEWGQLTEEVLYDSITKLINDPRYVLTFFIVILY